MGRFKKLKVWQEALDLTEMIYRVTKENSFARDF